MSKELNITELEGAVLGVIAVKGPCTPYVVRKEFQQSPTPFWSSSKSTIYPLIERLNKQKLVEVTSSAKNGRGGKLYKLTAKGDKVLRDWLYQPKSSQIFGTPPDPLRSRIGFLPLLTPEKRKSFLDMVRIGLEDQLKAAIEVSTEIDRSNFFDYLPNRGTILAAQARLDWIREIYEILEKHEFGETSRSKNYKNP